MELGRNYKQWPMWIPKKVEVDRPVSEYIREWADFTPNKIAISFYGLDITYAELNRLIDKAANGLIALGVKRGDHVGVMMDNSPQFAIAYFGAMRAGAAVVGVNPMFKEFELVHEMNDSRMRVLFCFDHLYPEVGKARGRTKVEHIIVSRIKDFLPVKPIFAVPEEKHPDWPIPDTISFIDFPLPSFHNLPHLILGIAMDINFQAIDSGS